MDTSNTSNLDELRGSGPYPIVCSKCGNRFGYAAAHPFLDEVLLGVKLVPKSERSGGYSDIHGYQRSGEQPIRPSLGYAPDSAEWKRQRRRRIVATGEGRFTFNCTTECRARPVATTPLLVRAYQTAHAQPPEHLIKI